MREIYKLKRWWLLALVITFLFITGMILMNWGLIWLTVMIGTTFILITREYNCIE